MEFGKTSRRTDNMLDAGVRLGTDTWWQIVKVSGKRPAYVPAQFRMPTYSETQVYSDVQACMSLNIFACMFAQVAIKRCLCVHAPRYSFNNTPEISALDGHGVEHGKIYLLVSASPGISSRNPPLGPNFSVVVPVSLLAALYLANQ